MTDRRGMALLAALWFVVAIATVGLALGLEAREHRTLGRAAADQRAAAAAAAGGLAIAQARLDEVLRRRWRTSSPAANWQRACASWIDTSLFSDTLYIGNFAVHLHAEDVGAKLNINTVEVPELRAFLAFLLRDYEVADALAQAIADWRDRDDLHQPRGAERDEYLARQRLDLPSNQDGFGNLEELRAVQGMTPEIFTRIRPYLRVRGLGRNKINVNTAPAPVLRVIPGITDAMITRILALRSQQRCILGLREVGGPSPLAKEPLAERMNFAVTFDVEELELTVTVVPPAPALPMQAVWLINRAGIYGHAAVSWGTYH